MGEDVIDRAEHVAGFVHRASLTAGLRVHGGKNAPPDDSTLAVYGDDASSIGALCREHPELNAAVHPSFTFSGAEVVWHVRHEMARTVEDVLARRTRSLLLNAGASIEAAPRVAELLARELGRDEAWRRNQVDVYTRLARGYVFTDPTSRGRTD